MTAPPPLGAMMAGVRYQVRVFWHHALAMLFPNSSTTKVVVEHRDVAAVDDVVVYYASPGMNDRGSKVDVDFFQVKYHVAKSGVASGTAVTDPAWIGTKDSLIRRFASAWGAIRPHHPHSRLTLVTNWPWDPACPLAPLIRDGGHLSDDFFTAGGRSNVGRIRKSWEAASGLHTREFPDFIRALRFCTSAVSLSDAEDWLRDRCYRAGLVPVGANQDHSAYDDLGKRLIESGRTEHTPASLRATLTSESLFLDTPQPFASTFAVRSFTRFVRTPMNEGAIVVDLTDLFDGRAARNERVWSELVPNRIESALPRVLALRGRVHVALDTHLSISWYIGSRLDSKSGVRILLEQKRKGTEPELWDLFGPLPPNPADEWSLIPTEVCADVDIALVVSVTHSALADALRSIATEFPSVGLVLHAQLPTPGPHAIRDGTHARCLSDELIRRVASVVAERHPRRIHLFLACPGALAFLLGQEWRTLGPTTVYEFDFGHPDRRYRPGMAT